MLGHDSAERAARAAAAPPGPHRGALVAAPWLAAVVLVNWLYNYGPRLSSNYAPLDLLCPCGYLLVIPLSCWLNGLPLPPARAWAHTVFFIVRSQLWIQTFDLDSDGRAGRRTTAVVLGLRRALQLLLEPKQVRVECVRV